METYRKYYNDELLVKELEFLQEKKDELREIINSVIQDISSKETKKYENNVMSVKHKNEKLLKDLIKLKSQMTLNLQRLSGYRKALNGSIH